MTRLAVVGPLRLDEVSPPVGDPPDALVELLVRRPAAIVSALADLVVRYRLEVVALAEPVAGDADGGYGARCLATLMDDLRARSVVVQTVVPGGEPSGPPAHVRVRPGSQEVDVWRRVGPQPSDRAWQLSALPDGLAAIIDTELPVAGAATVTAVLDPLVDADVAVRVDGPADPETLRRLLLAAASRLVAAHPYRYVVSRATLLVDDAETRRLLRWPAVAGRALADARTEARHAGLALWWDELRLADGAPSTPRPVGPGGPGTEDVQVIDLLGLSSSAR